MDTAGLMFCSIKKDYKVPYNITEFLNTSSLESDSGSRDLKAGGLAVVTGILIAFVVNILLSFEYYRPDGLFKSVLSKIFNAKNISRILVLTIIVLILPILVLFFILTSVYKVLCSVLIRKDKYFVGFLDNFDVFFSLDDDTSKSIINVFGVIESDSPSTIASNIKETLRNISPEDGNYKMFYRRNEKLGFYYWQRHSYIDLDQYVEIVELPHESDNSNVADLEYLLTDLQDQHLPYQNEGLFKIIITRQRVVNHSDERGDYGIIFRIHHSVGDGVALIECLCQSFADKTGSVNMFSMPENCSQVSPRNLLHMMHAFFEVLLCFVDLILRRPDDNVLHGPSLGGKKVFKWIESDKNLLMMVKDLKENDKQINFSDVLLIALSSGLRDYLKESMAPVPDDIAVILPVRFPKVSTDKDLILKNDFSVIILDLPVNDQTSLNEIKQRCKMLRKSADPLTNYYFVKIVCSLFPNSILRPLLYSNLATMVFSNFPGPISISICGGNKLKSLVFFVPNKGTTGLGVSALCYGGVLRFAAMADAALVPSSEKLSIILDGMVKAITHMHRRYVK